MAPAFAKQTDKSPPIDLKCDLLAILGSTPDYSSRLMSLGIWRRRRGAQRHSVVRGNCAATPSKLRDAHRPRLARLCMP